MIENTDNRIGILTIHDTTNFGSLFQTYSTYKVLNERGYQCEIINYHCDSIEKREKQKSLFEADNLKDIYRFFVYGPRIHKKYKLMNQFMNNELKISKDYYNDNIAEANMQYDTFFVGSDIVWGLSITDRDFTYFLDFAEENKRKYAFASSIGEKWNSNYDMIRTYLNRFDKIAVREEQARDWISEICSMHVDVVCDPTMLINCEEWDKLSRKSKLFNKLSKEKYILVYFENGEIFEDAKMFSAKYGYKIYHVNYRKSVKGIYSVKPYHPSDWLALIKNASLILTASYHGMLFSLYFNKEFYYYNRGWKSRMSSLAEYLGVLHREATQTNFDNSQAIDYENVMKLLKNKVDHSFEVLDTYQL